MRRVELRVLPFPGKLVVALGNAGERRGTQEPTASPVFYSKIIEKSDSATTFAIDAAPCFT
ncbi:MAG: hypothetical protein NTZ46_01175 [Verrucomicrobia bacterium]|nr:hypothetical protein [Verrucomicrobiota bacterium]